MNNNQMTTNDQQPALKSVNFGMYVNGRETKQIINRVITDKKKLERYITAIVSAVGINPELSKCTFPSILTGSLLAESLGLQHSPQIGHYYLVPFYDKKTSTFKATFVLGYKGYIQLAMRSGYYRKIIIVPVKEGELVHFDPFTEEYEFSIISDINERQKAPTAGYYAMFEYLNGFRKIMYWDKLQMMKHADKYSQAFSLNETTIKGKGGKTYHKVSYEDYVAGRYDKDDEWLYSSHWYTDFDGMACKTMIRQLISKWGIMSTEMQQAFESDSKVMNMSGNGDFVPTEIDEPQPENQPEMPPVQMQTPPQEMNIDDL